MHDTYLKNKLHILQAGRHLIAQKGFVGVGLSEILMAAEVPKGSFYHYFGSKERYGLELIEQYVAEYLQALDQMFDGHAGNVSARERLLRYWGNWVETQCCDMVEHKCLVVKLSAEVADFSDDMRMALHRGTEAFIARIAVVIAEGIADGSLPATLLPEPTAQMLYQMWLGASLLGKLSRDRMALDAAMDATRRILSGP